MFGKLFPYTALFDGKYPWKTASSPTITYRMLRFIYDHRLHRALPIEKTSEMVTNLTVILIENHFNLERICFMSLLTIGVFLYSPVMMALIIPALFILDIILCSYLNGGLWMRLLGQLADIIIKLEEGFADSIVRNTLDLPDCWSDDEQSHTTTSEYSWTERYIQKCFVSYINCFCDHPHDSKVGLIEDNSFIREFSSSSSRELFLFN